MACQTSAVLEPTSTEELAAGLKAYFRMANATGQSVKVRATHK